MLPQLVFVYPWPGGPTLVGLTFGTISSLCGLNAGIVAESEEYV
jgi:hypothetical protein